MSNPLDELRETYKTLRDAVKVAQRVLDGRFNPASQTGFHGMRPEEGRELLKEVERQIDKLMVFAFFATFERTLRDHLAASLEPMASSTTDPKELAVQLHTFLESNVDTWRVDHVLELFSPPATPTDVSNAKGIRTYRHHVAHGATPPAAMPPRTAYQQLTDFLRNAGLAE